MNCIVLKYILKRLLKLKSSDSIKERRETVGFMLLQQRSTTNSKNASKNLCVITGKARSVYRFSRLSRMELKRYTGFGFLNGLKPSS